LAKPGKIDKVRGECCCVAHKCKHTECTKDKQEWLPLDNDLESNKKTSQLKKHPYCKECGLVKSLRIDRAKPLGFYTNILRDLREYLQRQNKKTGGVVAKLSAVQMRLIIKELRDMGDFEDDFIRNRRAQIKIFVKVVKKHRPDLHEEMILHYVPDY